MLREVLALLAAGALLALAEATWALGAGGSLFLSFGEVGQYLLAATSSLSLLVLLLGSGLRAATRADGSGHRARIAWAALGLGLGAWSGTLLTEGRRVRDLAYRPLLVVAIALTFALFLIVGLRTATYVRERSLRPLTRLWAVVCFACVLGLMWADRSILPRGYPAFHASLFGGALVLAALAAAAIPTHHLPKIRRRIWGLPLVFALSAPLWIFLLARQSNASYAVAETAPFAHKILAPAVSLLGRKQAHPATHAATPVEAEAHAELRGIELRDQDVLLITVDALRADLLAAYGGKGATPVLDALARESVVFRRAYSPAPHTSYALSSLLTAKFMKPVFELPGAERDHPTLPDLLRRYSYRTAAFYPPAIFFVDGASFDELRQRGFGFEYRKEMFASGRERVQQLDVYLEQVEPNHPLFVWVHLFEPHEPYEPEPELLAGDSPRDRYTAEVRASDRDIGALIRSFRTARPNATVIVTADHGEEFGEHGGTYHGTTLYDEQVRVPLLWSSPGVVQPAVVDAPVELVDIGSTLLSAAGIPRDARMRGDDLTPLLAGQQGVGPKHAFASVERRHMVTDGKLKAICAAEEQHCQLYDLRTDPGEQRNLSSQQPDDVLRLRAELDRFFSTIASTEALAMAQGVGFPEVLARATLGAPGVGPELVPLLGDARPEVRAAAARALGELKQMSALPSLQRLLERDQANSVRAEASVAALSLGHEGAVDAVAALLTSNQDEPSSEASRSLVRRAALVLSRYGRPEALPELALLAQDSEAQEADRLRAISALGASADQAVLKTLIPLLGEVRLREHVAVALGNLGFISARRALVKQLEIERYEPARRAELRALAKLREPKTVALAVRFLGMESSIPDGVRVLMEQKALGPGSAYGGVLTDHRLRQGGWQCAADAPGAEHEPNAEGCMPEAGATVRFAGRTAGRPVRVTWLVVAHEASATFGVGEHTWPLRLGEQQVSMVLPGRLATRFEPRIEGKARLVAFAVTPVTEEIPAPPPEPWEASVEAADAGTESAADVALEASAVH